MAEYFGESNWNGQMEDGNETNNVFNNAQNNQSSYSDAVTPNPEGNEAGDYNNNSDNAYQYHQDAQYYNQENPYNNTYYDNSYEYYETNNEQGNQEWQNAEYYNYENDNGSATTPVNLGENQSDQSQSEFAIESNGVAFGTVNDGTEAHTSVHNEQAFSSNQGTPKSPFSSHSHHTDHSHSNVNQEINFGFSDGQPVGDAHDLFGGHDDQNISKNDSFNLASELVSTEKDETEPNENQGVDATESHTGSIASPTLLSPRDAASDHGEISAETLSSNMASLVSPRSPLPPASSATASPRSPVPGLMPNSPAPPQSAQASPRSPAHEAQPNSPVPPQSLSGGSTPRSPAPLQNVYGDTAQASPRISEEVAPQSPTSGGVSPRSPVAIAGISSPRSPSGQNSSDATPEFPTTNAADQPLEDVDPATDEDAEDVTTTLQSPKSPEEGELGTLDFPAPLITPTILGPLSAVGMSSPGFKNDQRPPNVITATERSSSPGKQTPRSRHDAIGSPGTPSAQNRSPAPEPSTPPAGALFGNDTGNGDTSPGGFRRGDMSPPTPALADDLFGAGSEGDGMGEYFGSDNVAEDLFAHSPGKRSSDTFDKFQNPSAGMGFGTRFLGGESAFPQRPIQAPQHVPQPMQPQMHMNTSQYGGGDAMLRPQPVGNSNFQNQQSMSNPPNNTNYNNSYDYSGGGQMYSGYGDNATFVMPSQDQYGYQQDGTGASQQQGSYYDPNDGGPESPAREAHYEIPTMNDASQSYDYNGQSTYQTYDQGLNQDATYSEVSVGFETPVPEAETIPAALDSRPTHDVLTRGTLIGSYRPSFDSRNARPSNTFVGTVNLSRHDGRPPHALVAWGFGGQLVTMFPQERQKLGGFGGGPMEARSQDDGAEKPKSLRKGPVRIYSMRHIVEQSESNFDGILELQEPLINSNLGVEGSFRNVDQLLNSRLSGTHDADEALLLEVLRLLIKFRGDLDQPQVADELGAILLQSSSGQAVPPNFEVNSEVSEEGRKAAMAEIEKMLSTGDREGAVIRAVESELWAQALIISNFVSVAAYQRVISRFVESTMDEDSNSRLLFKLFAGEGVTALQPNESPVVSYGHGEDYDGGAPPQISGYTKNWREALNAILMNRTPGDLEVIAALGDEILLGGGSIYAAHICYLIGGVSVNSTSGSRMILIGANHKVGPAISSRNFLNPSTIQNTEIFAFAQFLRNPNFRLDAFQSYRLVYAMWLAELGHLKSSFNWVGSIESAITVVGSPTSARSRSSFRPSSPRRPFPQAFQRELKIFKDRLKFSRQGISLGLNNMNTNPDTPAAGGGWIPKLRNTLSLFGSDRRLVKSQKTPREDNDQADNSARSTPPPADHDNVQRKLDFSQEAFQEKPPLPPKDDPVVQPPRPSDQPPAPAATSAAPAGAASEADKGDGRPKLANANTGSSWFSLGKVKEKLIQSLVPLDSKAKIAHEGKDMEAYYDEKLKRWVFPGDDPNAAAAGPPPPPPKVEMPAAAPGDAGGGPGAPGGGGPTPPMQFRAASNFKKGASRSRYVDTFGAAGKATGAPPPQDGPPKQSTPPLPTGGNFRMFNPGAAPPQPDGSS